MSKIFVNSRTFGSTVSSRANMKEVLAHLSQSNVAPFSHTSLIADLQQLQGAWRLSEKPFGLRRHNHLNSVSMTALNAVEVTQLTDPTCGVQFQNPAFIMTIVKLFCCYASFNRQTGGNIQDFEQSSLYATTNFFESSELDTIMRTTDSPILTLSQIAAHLWQVQVRSFVFNLSAALFDEYALNVTDSNSSDVQRAVSRYSVNSLENTIKSAVAAFCKRQTSFHYMDRSRIESWLTLLVYLKGQDFQQRSWTTIEDNGLREAISKLEIYDSVNLDLAVYMSKVGAVEPKKRSFSGSMRDVVVLNQGAIEIKASVPTLSQLERLNALTTYALTNPEWSSISILSQAEFVDRYRKQGTLRDEVMLELSQKEFLATQVAQTVGQLDASVYDLQSLRDPGSAVVLQQMLESQDISLNAAAGSRIIATDIADTRSFSVISRTKFTANTDIVGHQYPASPIDGLQTVSFFGSPSAFTLDQITGPTRKFTEAPMSILTSRNLQNDELASRDIPHLLLDISRSEAFALACAFGSFDPIDCKFRVTVPTNLRLRTKSFELAKACRIEPEEEFPTNIITHEVEVVLLLAGEFQGSKSWEDPRTYVSVPPNGQFLAGGFKGRSLKNLRREGLDVLGNPFTISCTPSALFNANDMAVYMTESSIAAIRSELRDLRLLGVLNLEDRGITHYLYEQFQHRSAVLFDHALRTFGIDRGLGYIHGSESELALYISHLWKVATALIYDATGLRIVFDPDFMRLASAIEQRKRKSDDRALKYGTLASEVSNDS